MKIRYEQLSQVEALEAYADWLLEQEVTEPLPWLRWYRGEKGGAWCYEWWTLFYPLRTLMAAWQLFKKPQYMSCAIAYFDRFVDEQLPNGGITANFRNQPSSQLSKSEYQEILRSGRINLADGGSNVHALIVAAVLCGDEARKKRYLEAARKWLDDWVPLWALPGGGYGNGFWNGQKINAPYSMAVNVCSALSAYTLVSGETEYVENAERAILFQCSKWLDDGRPIRMTAVSPSTFLAGSDTPIIEEKGVMEDYCRVFYLFEAMCWTHLASRNEDVKATIAATIKKWLFGEWGLLKQWQSGDWFSVVHAHAYPLPEGMYSTRREMTPPQELVKSNGLLYLFSYYLNNIEDAPEVRRRFEKGIAYLSNPLRSRGNGIVAHRDEPMGVYSVMSTGFAGLSLAEAIEPGMVFRM